MNIEAKTCVVFTAIETVLRILSSYKTWFAMRPQPLPPVIALWLASLLDLLLTKSWKQKQIMLVSPKTETDKHPPLAQ